MFSTIKAKLVALIGVAVLAIVSASVAGIIGMRSGSEAVAQLGGNMLPSTVGLMTIARGQLEGRVANREMELLEMDDQAPSKVAGVLEKKLAAFARMEKGAAIYEPLPGTPEEEEVWKSAKKNWAEWKVLNDKLNAMFGEVAKAKSKAELDAPVRCHRQAPADGSAQRQRPDRRYRQADRDQRQARRRLCGKQLCEDVGDDVDDECRRCRGDPRHPAARHLCLPQHDEAARRRARRRRAGRQPHRRR